MDLSLTFIGTAASTPSARRGVAANVVRRGGDFLLFDCGEGTQRQLIKSIGLADLEHIFLTHFHADHLLGIPGMLKTFALRGRELPLTIYGPPGLKKTYAALEVIFGRLPYSVSVRELDPHEEVRLGDYAVEAFAVRHQGVAYGYAVVEDERPGRFDEAAALALGVTAGPEFGRLQRGAEVALSDGSLVRPDQVLGAARPGRKVVISGDTAPCDSLLMAAYRADLLVHEASFGDDEAARAAETRHSTATQAAQTAREAQVKLLCLTHLSARYLGRELRDQARAIFPATELPDDFDTVIVPFEERGDPTLERARKRRPGATPPAVIA